MVKRSEVPDSFGQEESNFADRLAVVVNGMSGGNSVVESLPSKQMVAGSSPVPRSIVRPEMVA